MTIYIVTILFIFLLAFIEILDLFNYKYKLFFNIVLFIFLVLQVGLRWETGTDWIPYLNNFLETNDIKIVLFNSLIGFEIGYGFFVFLVRSLTEEYTVFLLIHAIIFYLLIFKGNTFLSVFPFFSLLLFYVSTIGVLGSNRQLIALAICLCSLKFVIDKKIFPFILSVFIAFLFHTSALIFLVYYFLYREFNLKQILGLLLFAFIIGNSSLPNIAFSTIGNLISEASAAKTDSYSGKESLGGFSLSFIGLIRRLLYFTIFALTYESISKKWVVYKLLFNGYLFGLILYFLFSNSLIILVSRGSLYFNVMEVFLISSQLIVFETYKERLIIFFLIFLYCFYIFFQSISVYSDLFLPYKGIFINTDYIRDLY